jgi:hypothetical protein
MNITERNFYRLLRAGALGIQEPIEPLSAWKWRRLYQLAVMHGVEDLVRHGIECCKDQFFVQVPEKLLTEWDAAIKVTKEVETDEGVTNPLLEANHLTNPLLNRRLQAFLDEEGTTTETRQLLLMITGVARFIMNAGIPVKRLAELAIFLKHQGKKVDYMIMDKWTEQLKLRPMTQLTGALLVRLMHLDPDDVPFMTAESEAQTDKRINEILNLKNSHPEEWYFSQGKNIFVHTSNPSAMLWHCRRSARYFHYYPAETMTNFFASFAHSLSHIEE